MSDDKTLHLLDASGFIFRAYHALPPLTRADGTPVGAVMGFCNILYKLLCDIKASHVAVIFDAKRENWRHEVYADYKANRPEPPEDLIPQFALIREATKAFSLEPLEVEGFEADDIIACYAKAGAKQGYKVVIVSSDKDLMQLIEDNVSMWDPIKQKPLGAEAVFEKFGVGPDKVVEVQSLIGDSTDNVPGVPGIGPKTAAELINTYGDLETVLDKAPEITKPKLRENLITYADQARISKRLVQLSCDAPLPAAIDSLETPKWNSEGLRDFLQQNGFKTLLNRIGAPTTDGAAPRSARQIDTTLPSPPAPKADIIPDGHAVTIDTSRYETITMIDQLKDFIQAAYAQGMIALDTETTGLTPAKCDLVGVSMALPDGRAAYIPIGHKTEGNLLSDDSQLGVQLTQKSVFNELNSLLADMSVLKVGHNLKYDIQLLSCAGVPPMPIADTMLISYVLYGSQFRHGLEELAMREFEHKMITFEEVAGKNGNFAHVDPKKATLYAAEDADITMKLYQRLYPRLVASKMLKMYERVERNLPQVIAEMEWNGIKIDTEFLHNLENEFSLKANALEEEIYQLAEGRFMLSSPKQLGEVLFERLKLPGGTKTKTGQWSTDAGTLEKLEGETDHPALKKILEWRMLTKLISTYTKALREAVNPRTGRVHTSYSLAATSTGRLASNDPNLQNIPIRTEEGRKIRTAFIAEPGHVLISADYSQIELRLIAEIADVKNLKDAFAKGEDIHAFTARKAFGVADDQELPADMRRAAKAINFGLIYGQSSFGLARGLGIPVGEAKTFIDAYFALYPEIKIYMDEVKKSAAANGYVETIFGRRCYIDGIKEKNPARRAGAERAAINAPIQGAAADLIKMAMLAIHDAKLPARMLLQVHDELILEVEESKAKDVAAQVKDIMENVVSLSVPLVAEAGIGPNWGAAH